MRKQVDDRAVLIEKKFNKRYDPKVDRAFNDVMQIKRQYDEIPKIKETMQKKQNVIVKSHENEMEMVNAQIRDLFHKEKKLLGKIESKNALCKIVTKEIDVIKQEIDLSHNSLRASKD
jgi:hypothetical protein